jgi:hypothetical protein
MGHFEIRNEEIEQRLATLGKMIGSQLPKEWGFALTIQSYGKNGSTFYTSNCVREDMVKLLRELADKLDGEALGAAE